MTIRGDGFDAAMEFPGIDGMTGRRLGSGVAQPISFHLGLYYVLAAE
jgi:hypothetical protein